MSPFDLHTYIRVILFFGLGIRNVNILQQLQLDTSRPTKWIHHRAWFCQGLGQGLCPSDSTMDIAQERDRRIHGTQEIHYHTNGHGKGLLWDRAADHIVPYPDFNQTFHVFTDASDYQLGGVIMVGCLICLDSLLIITFNASNVQYCLLRPTFRTTVLQATSTFFGHGRHVHCLPEQLL